MESFESTVSTKFFQSHAKAFEFMMNLEADREMNSNSDNEKVASPSKKKKHPETESEESINSNSSSDEDIDSPPAKKQKSKKLEVIITPPRNKSIEEQTNTSSDVKKGRELFANEPIKKEKTSPTVPDIKVEPSTSETRLVSPDLAGATKNPYKKASPREQRYSKRNNVVVTKKTKLSTESAFTTINATSRSIDDILKKSSITKTFAMKAEARNRMYIPDGTLVFYTFPKVPASTDGRQIFAMNIAGRAPRSTHWLFKAENVLSTMKYIVSALEDPEMNPYHKDYIKFSAVMKNAFYASIRKDEYSDSNAESGADTVKAGFQVYNVLCFVSADLEHSMEKIVEVLKCEVFYESYKKLFTGKIVEFLESDQLSAPLSKMDVATATTIEYDALNGLFVDHDIKYALSTLYGDKLDISGDTLKSIWKDGNVPDGFMME